MTALEARYEAYCRFCRNLAEMQISPVPWTYYRDYWEVFAE
jgi:hypothetical protein